MADGSSVMVGSSPFCPFEIRTLGDTVLDNGNVMSARQQTANGRGHSERREDLVNGRASKGDGDPSRPHRSPLDGRLSEGPLAGSDPAAGRRSAPSHIRRRAVLTAAISGVPPPCPRLAHP